jgi:hypothetical protein
MILLLAIGREYLGYQQQFQGKGGNEMDFDYKYATYVDEEGLKAIQELEKKTGKTILAYTTPPEAAQLSKEDVDKIKELEKKLCVRLVAYETH